MAHPESSPGFGRHLAAAARRFVFLLAGSSALIVVLSLLGAVLFGSGIRRAVSVGFYVVGSFLLVASFFIGNRGPARLESDAETSTPGGMFGIGIGGRKLRWATRDEQDDALANSGVFFALGLTLIVIGVAADDRIRLL